MGIKPWLTPEERTQRKKEQDRKQGELVKAHEINAEDLRRHEARFSSTTLAAIPNAAIRSRYNLGEGGRWFRPKFA